MHRLRFHAVVLASGLRSFAVFSFFDFAEEVTQLRRRHRRDHAAKIPGKLVPVIANIESVEIYKAPGHRITRSTVASVLKEHGIEPAPKRSRRMSWSTFLIAH